MTKLKIAKKTQYRKKLTFQELKKHCQKTLQNKNTDERLLMYYFFSIILTVFSPKQDGEKIKQN